MLPVFKDIDGEEWELRITIANLPALRQAGLDLSKTSTILEQIEALSTEQIAEIIWILCKKEAQSEPIKITKELFFESLDGASMYGAGTALMEAIADFTQSPSVAKESRRKIQSARAKEEAEVTSQLTLNNLPSNSLE